MGLGITWSKANERVYGYVKAVGGSLVTDTSTTLGTWAGNLASTTTVLMATNTTPSQACPGWAAHVAIFTSELSAAAIEDIITP